MFFRDVIGQEEIKQRLIQEVNEGRIPHAQLICGPEALLGNCGCIFSTFRRNSSHFCGMELADKEGCNSNVIFESPYIDSDFILYTPLIL